MKRKEKQGMCSTSARSDDLGDAATSARRFALAFCVGLALLAVGCGADVASGDSAEPSSSRSSYAEAEAGVFAERDLHDGSPAMATGAYILDIGDPAEFRLLSVNAVTRDTSELYRGGISPDVAVSREGAAIYVVSYEYDDQELTDGRDVLVGIDVTSGEEILRVDVPYRMAWAGPTPISLIATSLDDSVVFVNRLHPHDPEILPWGRQTISAIDTESGEAIREEVELIGCGSPVLEPVGHRALAVGCMESHAIHIVTFPLEGDPTAVELSLFDVRNGEGEEAPEIRSALTRIVGLHFLPGDNTLVALTANAKAVAVDISESLVVRVADLGVPGWVLGGHSRLLPDRDRVLIGISSDSPPSVHEGHREAVSLLEVDLVSLEPVRLTTVDMPFTEFAVHADSVLIVNSNSGVIGRLGIDADNTLSADYAGVLQGATPGRVTSDGS